MNTRTRLSEKAKEAISAVVPIVAIVLLLCFSVAPVPPGTLLLFLTGSVMLIAGMMFFTLGAEMAMTPMGQRMGASLSRTRRVIIILAFALVLGIVITVSEPDLQVLANQISVIPNPVLIGAVALGVGLFLMLAVLRMLVGISLQWMLIGSYAVVFILAFLVPKDFLAIAFDSGGVTTGPMTVPFIMALGVGVSAIRSDARAAEDSFGLVALASVGPILAVMLLAVIYRPEGAIQNALELLEAEDSVVMWRLFMASLPTYLGEIAVSLLPVMVLFAFFQLFVLHLDRRTLGRILVGLVYTYLGLVLFLTGANVGFMPAGSYLGSVLAQSAGRWAVVPVAMVMGYFIVRAEPAVYVLNRQVEEITDGTVSAASMGTALSLAVAVSLGLAMVRVLTGISVLWFLIPGYGIALILSFAVPRLYTAIAFDSGGVASGPMTAAFLLPFAQGACLAVGGNLATDAFGVVAMVAMTPLITIQLMGAFSQLRLAQARRREEAAMLAFERLEEDAIILL